MELGNGIFRLSKVINNLLFTKKRGGKNARGQGATTAGMSIQLGDDDRAHWHAILERLGLVLGRLADGGVHDEDVLVGAHRLADLLHLLEQGLLLLVATGGVHDDDVVLFLAELVHAIPCDDHRVGLRVAAHDEEKR